MERWNGRVALVTGASAGIGAGICRELVKHGLIVVGCARGVENIEAIAQEEAVKSAPGKLYPVKCDLEKESEIQTLFDYIRQKFGRIDICVNNAGFSTVCPLLTGKTNEWRSILQVNVLALCICTRESIKLMRENNIDDGQIIHISSVGGHNIMPMPDTAGFHFYCGTKFMLRAMTEGLRREVKTINSHIRVASISPGMVQTKFFERSFGKQIAKDYMEDKVGAIQMLIPQDVADAIIYILRCPPHVDVNDIIVNPIEQPF